MTLLQISHPRMHPLLPQSQQYLTSACRKRRRLELELLQSLQSSDDAVDELMSLWLRYECPARYTRRGRPAVFGARLQH